MPSERGRGQFYNEKEPRGQGQSFKLETTGFAAEKPVSSLKHRETVKTTERPSNNVGDEVSAKKVKDKTKSAKKRVTFSEPETQLANVSIRKKSRNCLYANVTVGDKRIQMLVDTGSPISILSEEIANKLGFMESQMPESDIKISGVDSSPIEVFGSVDCEIGLDSQKFAVEMTVAGIKGFSGILGIDFMEMYDVRLNIRKRTMVVLNQEVSLERVITRTGARLVLANVEKHYRHRARIKHTNANSVRFTQAVNAKLKINQSQHANRTVRCSVRNIDSVWRVEGLKWNAGCKTMSQRFRSC